jgi:serine/threonine-protein phosphatase PP1 catalytic subunit
MHGGLSEELLYARRLDILNNIRRPLRDEDVKEDTNPLAVNLLWADPDVNARPFGISRRGIGNVFGQEVIDRVLIRFDLDLIIRAHQVRFEFSRSLPFSKTNHVLRLSLTGSSSSQTTSILA